MKQRMVAYKKKYDSKLHLFCQGDSLPNKGDWNGRAPEVEELLKCNEGAKSLSIPKISGCMKVEF